MGGNVPLGYDPDGRTLKVNESDAQTVRALYDFYDKHRNIRLVKAEADNQGLKTAIRQLSSGRLKGGTAFSFGHVYHILTNPIYAGRIRHKAKIWPGQHPALIEPTKWDALQEHLKGSAVMQRSGKERSRGGKKKPVSLLIGKVFDETGDRLTPSHTKTGKGRRLRYYVSHRLIRSAGPKDPSGWRLPAPELESLVVDLISKQLKVPAVQASIVSNASTEQTAVISQRLSDLIDAKNQTSDVTNNALLSLVENVHIAPGKIRISIATDAIAAVLDVDLALISEDRLSIEADFRQRKRGVETKLILADASGARDETLFKNVALAHRYFDMIRSGKTYTEIAEAEGVSKRRMQQLLELAFLAPDIIRDIWEGRQPVGLTSHWLKSHAFTPTWSEQRELFKAL